MIRALITSGGGAKGAFTVGALNELADMGIDQYDIISGTSTGALIAALTVAGKFSLLERVYLEVDNDDILKKQNIVDNILNDRPFLYDTDPLLNMIRTHITQDVFEEIMDSPTVLCLTAISLQTGKATVFTTKNIPPTSDYLVSRINTLEELTQALLASGSQAGFLKPVTIQTGIDENDSPIFEQFVDGGNRDVIPSRVATDLNPNEIYVLSNNPIELFQENVDYSRNSVLKVIFRAIAIFIQDVRENDIAVLDIYKRMTGAKIFRIEPEKDLDPAHPTGLNFNFNSMTIWMAKGRQKVRQIVPAIV